VVAAHGMLLSDWGPYLQENKKNHNLSDA